MAASSWLSGNNASMDYQEFDLRKTIPPGVMGDCAKDVKF
jgi:hypothetical protein